MDKNLMAEIRRIEEEKTFDIGTALPKNFGIVESLGSLNERERAIYTCSIRLNIKLREKISSRQSGDPLSDEREIRILEKQHECAEQFFWFQVIDRLNLWDKTATIPAFGIIKGRYVIPLDMEMLIQLFPYPNITAQEVKTLDDLPEEVREGFTKALEGLGFYQTKPGSGEFSHN